MFIITSYKRNPNYDHSEIAKVIHSNVKSWQATEKLHHSSLLSGRCKMVLSSGKYSPFFKNLNIYIPCDSTVSFLGITPEKQILRSALNLFLNVHSIFICISKKLETIQTSVTRRIIKMWYSHTVEYCLTIKRN